MSDVPENVPRSTPQTAPVPVITRAGRPSRWWLEPELGLLILFAIGAYFTRMTDLSIRGEESRRGLIAREMLQSGDWIVPRCQGVPLFSRPPLQNWLIALIGSARGEIDAVALRLPSDCAMLLLALLIYGYSRSFLTRLGALSAGAAYLSMGQVLELGRMGETDALFTLFLSGSLLVWHFCFTKGAAPYRTWLLGYCFAALGTLTKGPQAPVYFAAVVGAHLIWTRQWRFALSRAHAAGIGLFVLIVGAWQVPFLLKMGFGGSEDMYITDIGHRFLDTSWQTIVEHTTGFPFEVIGCMLPWSVLLGVLCWPRVARKLGPGRSHVAFLVTCLAVTFPTVWLPPGGRPRYFYCLYPCAAVLVGAAVDRLWQARRDPAILGFWSGFVRLASIAMIAAGAGTLALALFGADFWLTQTPLAASLYALASSALAALAWTSLRRDSRSSRGRAVLALATFMAISHCTVMINSLRASSVDTAGAVAELKQKLPAGTKLVSFGPIHHMFVFYYDAPIPVEPWPRAAGEVPEDVDYFCVEPGRAEREKLPFPWEVVSEVSCSRRKVTAVLHRVIIGRRIAVEKTADARERDAK